MCIRDSQKGDRSACGRGKVDRGTDHESVTFFEPVSYTHLDVYKRQEQLLPTIRSRVQSFTLRPPSKEAAAAYVQEHAAVSTEQARELAALCGGNIGRMLGELSGGDSAAAFAVARQMAKEMALSLIHI